MTDQVAKDVTETPTAIIIFAHGSAVPEANEKYNEELEKLTAAEWLETFR